MVKLKDSKITAQSHRDLLEASKDIIEQIKKEINEKYQKELNNSGFVKKQYLKFRIRREIQKAINKIAPWDGLYLKSRQNKHPA